MAASKGLLHIIGQILDGSRKVGSAGTISEQALKDLQRLNFNYVNPELLLFQHGVSSRGWSKEKMAEKITELLNSEKTMAVPNFKGGNRKALEALTKPEDPLSIFAPVFPTREGGAGLATIIETSPERILFDLEQRKKLLSSQRGGPSLIPGQPSPFAQAGSDAVSQLDLSAVGSHAALQEIIDRFKGGVKSAAPYAVGAGATGGLLGAMGAEAQAAEYQRKAQEQALEEPWFNPIDMLLAPIGATTWAGRGLAALAEPVIAGLLHFLGKSGGTGETVLSRGD